MLERLNFPITKKEAEKQGIQYSSEKNYDAKFPSKLRDLRKEKGVTQAALAKALGISKSTVGLYETGDTLPDAKTLYDLSNYFHVSADYLLGLSGFRNYEDRGITAEQLGMSEVATTKQLEFWNKWAQVEDTAEKNVRKCYLKIWNSFLESDAFSEILHKAAVCVRYTVRRKHLMTGKIPFRVYSTQKLIDSEEKRAEFLDGNDSLRNSYNAFTLQNAFMNFIDITANKIADELLLGK